jgi:tyrosinase
MKGVVVQMQSLEVVVLATPMSQVPGKTFPDIGEPHYYYDVTYGRPGGSRHI